MDPIEALRMRGIGVGKKLVGDAVAADVRAGKTFSNAQGNDKIGTLAVRSTAAQTVTPTTSSITKQSGIYDGDITIQGDASLVAANILSGRSIFGVAGNVIAGKRFATGTVGSPGNVTKITVAGLSFKPSVVFGTTDWGTESFIAFASPRTAGSVLSAGTLLNEAGTSQSYWDVLFSDFVQGSFSFVSRSSINRTITWTAVE